MTSQLLQLPGHLDLLHLILIVTTIIGFALYFGKVLSKSPADATTKDEVAAEVTIETTPKAEEKPQAPVDHSALQLLSLLQQEGRLIDFLYEDVSEYQDADIGAAARVIHQGSQKVLKQYFTLSPIRTEEEESRITLDAGFNTQEIQLTGNVTGSAPFTGTLVHKGWRVDQTNLPVVAEGHDCNIIAKAEVEL